jgi:hypothetical protein
MYDLDRSLIYKNNRLQQTFVKLNIILFIKNKMTVREN